jgi:hypothetical protein
MTSSAFDEAYIEDIYNFTARRGSWGWMTATYTETYPEGNDEERRRHAATLILEQRGRVRRTDDRGNVVRWQA